jgi:hypothetical protein
MRMEMRREPDNSEKLVMTVCNSHCGGTCPLKLHIKEGVYTPNSQGGHYVSRFLRSLIPAATKPISRPM